MFETFHPTFLYELIWSLIIGFTLIYFDKKYRLGHGRVFALYVALYSFGRLLVETFRIDESRILFGLRFNIWTSLLVIVGGLVYFMISSRSRPGRDQKIFRS